MTQGGKRPSLARVHTRGTDAKRSKELDTGLRITVDGDVFEVRVGEVTPELAGQLRRHTGMSFMALMRTCGDDPDVDVLNAFEWLARRIRGEDVEFEDVGFSYEDMMHDSFEIEPTKAPEPNEGDDPEA